jgi:hypothetical protein
MRRRRRRKGRNISIRSSRRNMSIRDRGGERESRREREKSRARVESGGFVKSHR